MEQKEQHLRTELSELEKRLEDPAIFSTREYPRLAKRRQELEHVTALLDERKSLAGQKQEAEDLLSSGDTDLVELAEAELEDLRNAIATNDTALHDALTPKDPNDDRDVVIEVRAAAGGDEASLFGAELYRMYTRWAERHNYKVEIVDESPSEVGGFKEIIFGVRGEDIYKQLKFEAGVHRVQRSP